MLNLPETITITNNGVILPKLVSTLIPNTDPILHTKLEPFDFERYGNLAVGLSNNLIEAMKRYGGIGLAANQIGCTHRVFVMGTGDNIIAYFNPEILEASENKVTLSEGCLSYMGLFLKISRPERIIARYQDFEGEFHDVSFSGLTARTFQHELDHLNGIVFTSHVGPVALKFAKDKQKKHEKQAERRRPS